MAFFNNRLRRSPNVVPFGPLGVSSFLGSEVSNERENYRPSGLRFLQRKRQAQRMEMQCVRRLRESTDL